MQADTLYTANLVKESWYSNVSNITYLRVVNDHMGSPSSRLLPSLHVHLRVALISIKDEHALFKNLTAESKMQYAQRDIHNQVPIT